MSCSNSPQITSLARRMAGAFAVACALGPAAGSAAGTPAVDVHTVGKPDSALTYWTTKRMRTVDRPDLPVAARGASASSRPPAGRPDASRGTVTDVEIPSRSKRGRPASGTAVGRASYVGLELPWHSATRYGYASALPPVGRVWMTSGGRRLACSGTVVAKNIVLTAAHCVRDGRTGAWDKNVVFTPAVEGTRRPFKKFAARQLVVPSRWATVGWNDVAGTGGGGYYPQDYAFLVLRKNRAKRHVSFYTGSYGILANAPHGSIYHLGYPYEGRWSACKAKNCHPWQVSSVVQRYSQYAGSKYDVGMSGYNSGGSSGGPWFQQWNGQWYVSSVQSHMGVARIDETRGRHGLTHFGPYFDSDTLSVLSYAQSL